MFKCKFIVYILAIPEIFNVFLMFQPKGSEFVQSRYRINRPLPGAAQHDKHRAGPFDMGKILSKLSSVRAEAGTMYGAAGGAGGAAAAAGGAEGGIPVAKAGYRSILSKPEEGKKKIGPKFKKDVTIRSPSSGPMHQQSLEEESMSDTIKSDQMSDTVRSMSNVHIDGDWDRTLTAVQQQTATDAINVMQMIVKTMTGLFPVSYDFIFIKLLFLFHLWKKQIVSE